MGGMRILFASYRDWSNQIFERLDNKEQFDRVHSQQELLAISPKEYDLIFFVGWSEIIPDEYILGDNCICLHPSPLPKYRGGSPIQHQIISGETESAVTLFFMNSELDAGDIIFQKEFSLSGELSDIFNRIILVGSEGISQVISDYQDGKLTRSTQDESVYRPHRRRKEEDSEILISDLSFSSAKELHDKIRSLADPYPNAFIRCKDGSKLFITGSHYGSPSEMGKKEILVLGHNGMLGHMVGKYLSQDESNNIVTINHRFPSNEFKDAIINFTGDYIINCIGSIPQKSKEFSINTELPKWLELNSSCRIIHPSTDCEMDQDEYGISKRKAVDFLLAKAKKTKIIKCSIIGPELSGHNSLLDWFLLNENSSTYGFTDAIWNGVTTLEWAKVCSSLINDWDRFKRINVVEGERISKYDLLHLISDLFDKQIEIIPMSGKGKDKSLTGEIKSTGIKDQLIELKEFYYPCEYYS